MQAIRVTEFGDPAVMGLTEIPDLTPAAKQLKIEVRAIGVNPVDAYIRSGIYPMKPELPYTPGLDAAGFVKEVGSDVDQFTVGDRVYVFGSQSGTYAEELICNQDQAYHLPDNVNFSAGAAIGVPYSTAYYALHYRAHALPAEKLLVHGASGAVGLAAIQIARSEGLDIYATAGSEAGLALLRDSGVIQAYRHDQDGYQDAIRQATKEAGVDVILEMLANQNLDADLKLLSRFGRVVIIGNRGRVEIDPRDTMGKNSAILGMAIFNASRTELAQIHAAIYAGLSDGRYHPVIRQELPMAEAPKAHEMVFQSGGNGKIVLIP